MGSESLIAAWTKIIDEKSLIQLSWNCRELNVKHFAKNSIDNIIAKLQFDYAAEWAVIGQDKMATRWLDPGVGILVRWEYFENWEKFHKKSKFLNYEIFLLISLFFSAFQVISHLRQKCRSLGSVSCWSWIFCSACLIEFMLKFGFWLNLIFFYFWLNPKLSE